MNYLELEIPKGFVNLNRAYEIHRVVKLPIMMVANLNDYPAAQRDFNTLKEVYPVVAWNDVFTAEVDRAGFIIELIKPDFNELFNNHKAETFSDVIQRTKDALKSKEPDDYLSESSETLLKHAYERLNLGFSDVDKIKIIAKAIARLNQSTKIDTVDIAEAIQYRCITQQDQLTVLNIN